MPSTLTWLDFSEKERRKNLEIISLFKNQDARDELGLGTIRDAIADALFPGTGTMQTRARYFFFVPWIYLKLERKKTSSSEVTSKARAEEIRLIELLLESGEKDGVIGVDSRENLQRLPSSIYWIGLHEWGIRKLPGSQSDYHRYLDKWYTLDRSRNDDKELINEQQNDNWNPNIPLSPKGFPDRAQLALTKREAQFLRNQILLKQPDSLLAHLLRNPRSRPDDDGGAEFIWMHPRHSTFPENHKTQLHHARCFSEVMHGASYLYNLMIARLVNDKEHVREYTERMEEWGSAIDAERARIHGWSLTEFWSYMLDIGNVHPWTRRFVEAWVTTVRSKAKAVSVIGDRRAEDLIRERERELKTSRSRLLNASAREMWKGAAGIRQLNFRWSNASIIINDILAGLGGSDHA
jgi:hypothetical protein